MAILSTGFKKRAEIQLQTEAAECGLACLAMISTIHGFEADLRTLRQKFSTSLMGITLEQLIKNARELGFSTRPLRTEIEELKDIEYPCILHFDMNHFVVLNGRKNTKFEILDPAYGRKYFSFSELSSRFTGVVLEFIPELGFKKQKRPRGQITITNLLGKIRGLTPALLKIFLLSSVIEIFSLLGPFLNQWAVDEAIVSEDVNLLYTIIVGFVMVSVMQTITEALWEFALLHLSSSLNLQWFTRVFGRLIRLPLVYFEKRQMGDVIARADTVTVIQSTISSGLIEGVVDGVMAIGTFAMMWLYSPKLASLSAAILSLYILLRALIYRAIRSASESQFVFSARLQTYLIETIRGIQTIKLFGKESVRLTALINRSVRSRNSTLRVLRYGVVFKTANALLFRLEAIIVLAFAGSAVIDKTFTIGMLIAFTSFREQFARRISSLVDKVFDFKMLGVQTERLADIMLGKPENFTRKFSVPFECEDSALIVKRLSYRYAEGLPNVIDGIDLKIHAGEHVVIVGPSGCGKTTLLKLLTGLCNPSSGDILYGNISISSLGSQYRDICATVTQDDVLFAGSIAENITFFDDHPNHDFLKECAVMAGIDSEILLIPMGYDTLVGDMGSALSGGQKQRVLLARAFYKKPKILFLDEATSHLDSNKENEILSSISKLKITRIVIAHRRETIESADRIIQLSTLNKLRRDLK